jgi:hypothetical protein
MPPGGAGVRVAFPVQNVILPLRTNRRSSMTEAAILITQGEVQLVAGILAVILVAIALLRRKGKKKSDEDEF